MANSNTTDELQFTLDDLKSEKSNLLLRRAQTYQALHTVLGDKTNNKLVSEDDNQVREALRPLKVTTQASMPQMSVAVQPKENQVGVSTTASSPSPGPIVQVGFKLPSKSPSPNTMQSPTTSSSGKQSPFAALKPITNLSTLSKAAEASSSKPAPSFFVGKPSSFEATRGSEMMSQFFETRLNHPWRAAAVLNMTVEDSSGASSSLGSIGDELQFQHSPT